MSALALASAQKQARRRRAPRPLPGLVRSESKEGIGERARSTRDGRLLVVWAGGDAGCRCAGIGDGRARGATLVRQRCRLCSSAIRGCEPSAFITNTSPLHSAVAREGDPACRLAEPRLSGFAGQATLAWATF